MKIKPLIYIVAIIGLQHCAKAQLTYTISFFESEKTTSRDKKNETTYKFLIKTPIVENADVYNLQVTIGVDEQQTNISSSAYKLDAKPITVKNGAALGETPFYLTLNPDSLADRERQIVFKLKVLREEKDIASENKGVGTMTVKIKAIETPKNDSLKSYRYLAFIGTNFDLVDGVKAKNLFFATNIYLPNESTKGLKIGGFVSLYGNRTITSTDSLNDVSRVTKIKPLTDSTANYYFEKADRITQYSSDNIGAYFCPLINLGQLSNKNNVVKLYFNPSAEFIWRRTHTQVKYSNSIASDTVTKNLKIDTEISLQDRFTTSFNQFQFNVGALGFYATHENENISVRLYCAVGQAMKYIPTVLSSSNLVSDGSYQQQKDYFFSGRIWITEARSGLTLQAEITNTWKYPTPYYGVTLSKAISFSNLGTIFSPLTAR